MSSYKPDDKIELFFEVRGQMEKDEFPVVEFLCEEDIESMTDEQVAGHLQDAAQEWALEQVDIGWRPIKSTPTGGGS